VEREVQKKDFKVDNNYKAVKLSRYLENIRDILKNNNSTPSGASSSHQTAPTTNQNIYELQKSIELN
jgi:hypothetical protein